LFKQNQRALTLILNAIFKLLKVDTMKDLFADKAVSYSTDVSARPLFHRFEQQKLE